MIGCQLILTTSPGSKYDFIMWRVMHSPQLEQSIPVIVLETKHGDILQLKEARQVITYVLCPRK